ncbi:GerAB/ArcD/ProY family transporter [Paenibacillus piri]|uniref:Spore gernimation protein n=1 Tax=Paenibacillus piri TaxID=2547395 RepID=A0A4R5KFV0_9BACL|nr:endospore germination permease [Paenibacillus piri]TDF93862.1 spore gernimation protein [Paenibacillus piri]
MDQKQIINYRQFSWLTASLLSGGGVVSIQQVLIRINSADAWMSYTIPTLYVAALSYVFSQMVRRFPGKNIFEITKILFGGLIGTIVNLILLVHLWLILIRDLSSFSKFIGITLLPNTPEEIVVMLFVCLLLYYGKTSVEVLARVNDVMFPLFVVMILVLPLMLVNESDHHSLLPVMTGSVKNFLSGNMISIGWYGDVFVMGAFLHTIWESKQVQASIRHGVILATMMIGIFLVMDVLVLGPNMPSNFLYPSYSLVQQIHITDFLDRMDLIILSVWFPVTACEVILIHLAFITGIASLVKQRDYSSINTPVVLLLLLTTLLSFNSTTEVFSFGHFSSPVIVLCYQPLLFLLIWLFSLRHPVIEGRRPQSDAAKQQAGQGQHDQTQQQEGQDRRLSERSGAAEGGNPQQNEESGGNRPGGNRTAPNQGNPARPKFPSFTFLAWKRCSNILLLMIIVSICAGMWLSKKYAAVGLTCALLYGCCLLLAVWTSSMEMYMSKQHRKW